MASVSRQTFKFLLRDRLTSDPYCSSEKNRHLWHTEVLPGEVGGWLLGHLPKEYAEMFSPAEGLVPARVCSQKPCLSLCVVPGAQLLQSCFQGHDFGPVNGSVGKTAC